MGSQRILDNTQVNWFEGDVNRLSYQMIFDDQEFEEPVTEEQPVEEEIDVAALLEENNAEWQQKLDEAKEEYYQSGFDEGFEKGLAEHEKGPAEQVRSACIMLLTNKESLLGANFYMCNLVRFEGPKSDIY